MGGAGETCEDAGVNAYQRITEAIRFIDANRGTRLDLASVATAVGMSPAGFHRLFSTWTDAKTPDVMQCLTLRHARELLAEGGRGDKPRVSLNAASPAEIRSRGSGLSIRAGVAESPFGHCLLGESPRGLCHLSFFDEDGRDRAIEEMRLDWPAATLAWDDDHAAHLATRIFREADPAAEWRLFVRGTAFQLRVWQALLHVRPGTLVSYGNLATAAGHPQASRATGSAVGGNAISFLIPCHRVIRETGIPGHYRWGALRKRAILAWESARRA